MKILAFAASNNPNSINQQLALYTAGLLKGANIDTLNIDDFEMPIFSDAREQQLGQPQEAKDFVAKVDQADAIVLSFAEHNGTFTAAFKNLYDWASRVRKDIFGNKPALFLATSPGQGGALSVLTAATQAAPYMGADLKASVSIPKFFENFDTEQQTMRNPELNRQLKSAIETLKP